MPTGNTHGNHHLSIPEYWSGRAHAYDLAQQVGQRAEIEKTLWRQAFHMLHLDEGHLRILDVGCGSGYVSGILRDMGHDVVGIDSSPGMVAEAQAKGLNVVLSDAATPPANLGLFDAVVSRYVMWTLPDPVGSMRAWKNMLDPAGPGIIACADANWFPEGRNFDVDVDSTDGEKAFTETYDPEVTQKLPLSTVTSPEPYLDVFRHAGLEPTLKWLPEISRLDFECGTSKGHVPAERFLVWADGAA